MFCMTRRMMGTLLLARHTWSEKKAIFPGWAAGERGEEKGRKEKEKGKEKKKKEKEKKEKKEREREGKGKGRGEEGREGESGKESKGTVVAQAATPQAPSCNSGPPPPKAQSWARREPCCAHDWRRRRLQIWGISLA